MSKFRVNIEKALTGSTAGTILMQPEIDKVIGNLVDYKNPLRQNLTRKQGSGDSWVIIRRAVSGITGSAWVADTDETGIEKTGTYTRHPFAYKTCLARGKVTRKLQATGRSYTDVLATEMENKAIEFKNDEDQCIVAGSTGVSTNQFDGLRYLVPSTQQVVAGCVVGSGTAPCGGCALTLSELDEAIDECAGAPDMLVMSKRSRRALNALLQISQRFLDRVEVRGGFKLLSYNDIPIYVSTNIVNTQAVAATGVTSETTGRTSSIYVVDSENTWVGELTPLTVVPLAKKSSQYDEFDILCDEVLVVRNPIANAKLIGILPPGDLG